MIKNLLLLLCLITSLSVFAQDKIYLHSGKVIDASIKQVGQYTITYIYKGESANQVIGKQAVKKVVYGGSNREEEISPFISVKSEDDWEKVVVLEDKSQTAGLHKEEEIEGKGGGKFVNEKHAELKSITRLKKSAARLKCPFVYISSNSTRGVGIVCTKVSKSGVAYRY